MSCRDLLFIFFLSETDFSNLRRLVLQAFLDASSPALSTLQPPLLLALPLVPPQAQITINFLPLSFSKLNDLSLPFRSASRQIVDVLRRVASHAAVASSSFALLVYSAPSLCRNESCPTLSCVEHERETQKEITRPAPRRERRKGREERSTVGEDFMVPSDEGRSSRAHLKDRLRSLVGSNSRTTFLDQLRFHCHKRSLLITRRELLKQNPEEHEH